jgi:hypothetical protein
MLYTSLQRHSSCTYLPEKRTFVQIPPYSGNSAIPKVDESNQPLIYQIFDSIAYRNFFITLNTGFELQSQIGCDMVRRVFVTAEWEVVASSLHLKAKGWQIRV